MSTANHPTRGVDHIGITVPDLDAASHFLEEALDAVPLYDSITRTEPPMRGPQAEQLLDLSPGTALIAMRMMKLANGPGIELFEMKGPMQHSPVRPSDFGLQHFAVYVDDMAAAIDRFTRAGGKVLSGPSEMLGLEKGHGNVWAYAQAPWGSIIELLTSPSPQDYEKQTTQRRWKPQPY